MSTASRDPFAIAAALPAPGPTDPSPCEGWTVHEVALLNYQGDRAGTACIMAPMGGEAPPPRIYLRPSSGFRHADAWWPSLGRMCANCGWQLRGPEPCPTPADIAASERIERRAFVRCADPAALAHLPEGADLDTQHRAAWVTAWARIDAATDALHRDPTGAALSERADAEWGGAGSLRRPDMPGAYVVMDYIADLGYPDVAAFHRAATAAQILRYRRETFLRGYGYGG